MIRSPDHGCGEFSFFGVRHSMDFETDLFRVLASVAVGFVPFAIAMLKDKTGLAFVALLLCAVSGKFGGLALSAPLSLACSAFALWGDRLRRS
jgi:hypothetical protein